MEKIKQFFKEFKWELIACAIGVFLFVVDIVTKQVMVNYFRTHDDPIVLIPGVSAEKPFLRINYVINTAAAFGFGLGSELANRIMYCIIAAIGFIGILIFFFWKRKIIPPYVKVCMMLIAAGAIGNLVDRIFYTPAFLHNEFNGVVDWIDFAGIWGFVFNIADSCVVVACFMLIAWLIVEEVKEYKKNKQPKAEGKVLSSEEKARLEEEKEHVEKELEEIEQEKEENKEDYSDLIQQKISSLL